MIYDYDNILYALGHDSFHSVYIKLFLQRIWFKFYQPPMYIRLPNKDTI